MSPAQRGRVEANGAVTRKRPWQRRGSTSSSVPDGDDDVADDRRGRRRRAPTACRACRARKVRCSNERPTCAACARLRCECVYPEPARYGLPSPDGDRSEVIHLLQEILHRLPSASTSHPNLQTASDSALQRRAAEEESPHIKPRPPPSTSNSIVGTSPRFTSLEHIFKWHMFDPTGAERFKDVVLAADHLRTVHPEATRPPIATSGAGVAFMDGDEIAVLLTKFLRQVHVADPVMHCKALLDYGREVAELGPRWDAKTCIVHIAAALSVIAKPFSPVLDTVDSLKDSASRDDDVHTRQKAESYYESARRRFGLLDRSLTACYCHFWSGVYLMYTMRPLQAWQSFFEASTLYTVYLKGRAAAQAIDDSHDYHDEFLCRLEQRLYWSCIKAESEIELPRSGLHNIDCNQFPSPPTPESVPGLDGLHEHSWFSYLSDISLLRLSSRVNHAFYTQGPASWMSANLLDMMNVAWDFETQLKRWQETLPSAISCFDASLDYSTVTERQLATWSRAASIKLRLYRPFLYRLASRQGQDWLLCDTLRLLAEKAVLVSLDPLCTLGLRHRHAGTWHKCRETAARALILLCAEEVGLTQRMGVEGRVDEMLDVYVWHLRYWEGEAGDLRPARQVIERIIRRNRERKDS